jgi:hypothetical protein
MESTITIITGKVAYDVFGSYSDCSPGLYIDKDKVVSLLDKFVGKEEKITIEVIAKPEGN